MDWCVPPASKQKIVLTLIRYLSVFILLLLLIFHAIFQLMQLILGVIKAESIQPIISNLTWFPISLFVTFCQLIFLINRKTFLQFFHDFKFFEKTTRTAVYKSTSKLRMKYLFIFYSVLINCASSLFAVVIFTKPSDPIFFTSIPLIRENFNSFLAGSIQLIILILSGLFLALADLVPSFVYHQIAENLDLISRDVENIFRFNNVKQTINCSGRWIEPESDSSVAPKLEIYLLKPWKSYDAIRRFVDRADTIFGLLVAVNHGLMIFFSCLLGYAIFYDIKNHLFEVKLISSALFLIFNISRMLVTVVISSRLHLASGQFKFTLESLLGQNWDRMTKEERDLLIAFIGRLKLLVASPLEAYHITPPFLLTLLSLCVTYVVILLQAP